MENANDEPDDIEKELMRLFYDSPDSQTMLREIAHQCGATLRVDTCLIIAGVASGETAQVGYWHKNEVNFTITEQFLAHAEINQILANEQPVLLAGLSTLLSVQTGLGVRTEFHGIVNGLILLGKVTPNIWTPDEQNRLLQMSKPVSIACMLAQKENRANERDINPSLNLANFNRGVSVSEIPIIKRLYDLTRQQLEQQRHLLEQQRQLNDQKNEIIAAISDRARNPLASMKMAISTLSDPKRKLPTSMQENYWNILRKEWSNLNDLINSIVTLEQLQSKEINFQPQAINLSSFIQDIARTFREQWSQDRRKALTLEINSPDSSLQLYTDLQHLKSIIQELLINAANFSVSEQTVFVAVSQACLDHKKVISFTVTNTGIGIPDEEKESIYEPFYRGKGIVEKGIPGTGVGLAVVKGLVELIGGSIEVMSEAVDNFEHHVTTFTLTLPLDSDSQC